MNRNWPDRIKLVLVYIVLNVVIGTAISVIILFQDFAKEYFNTIKQVFFIGILASIFITIPIFIYYWKQLRRQEETNATPDMQDMRNIPTGQLLLFLLGFPFLVGGFVVFQLYSKLAGVLCLIIFLVLWVIDIVYTKRRYKKIIESKKSGP